MVISKKLLNMLMAVVSFVLLFYPGTFLYLLINRMCFFWSKENTVGPKAAVSELQD
jgi:hypothetical protein